VDISDDFCNLLEGKLGVSLPPLTKRYNTSLSAEAMQILLDYRQSFWLDNGCFLTSDTLRLVRFLEASRNAPPQTRPVLKDEIAARIRANHAADAKVILERYGVDLGLRDRGPTAALRSRETYRVSDIVQSVDADIVQQILLRLARAELARPHPERSQPLEIAARLYRSVPPHYRPQRLKGWLLRFIERGRPARQT
jgi:hypothetical protein